MRWSGLLVAGIAAVLAGTALAAQGDPQKKLTKAGQARARAVSLKLADVGKGWTSKPSTNNQESSPRCSTYNPDQSDLIETGSYDSPEFSRPDGTFVSSTTGLFKTAAMARAGYARVAVPALPHCFAEIFKKAIMKPSSATIVSAGPLPFPRYGDARTHTGSRPSSGRRRPRCGRRSTWWCSIAARSTSRSSSWASTRRCPRASSRRSSPRSRRAHRSPR